MLLINKEKMLNYKYTMGSKSLGALFVPFLRKNIYININIYINDKELSKK